MTRGTVGLHSGGAAAVIEDDGRSADRPRRVCRGACRSCLCARSAADSRSPLVSAVHATSLSRAALLASLLPCDVRTEPSSPSLTLHHLTCHSAIPTLRRLASAAPFLTRPALRLSPLLSLSALCTRWAAAPAPMQRRRRSCQKHKEKQQQPAVVPPAPLSSPQRLPLQRAAAAHCLPA